MLDSIAKLFAIIAVAIVALALMSGVDDLKQEVQNLEQKIVELERDANAMADLAEACITKLEKEDDQ